MSDGTKQLQTVATADEFDRRWGGVHNFLLAADLCPFDFELPELDRIVAELLLDQDSVVVNAGLDPFVHTPRQDQRNALSRMPIEKVLEQPISICHYDLRRFDGPGSLLEGLEAQLLRPWRTFLQGEGFILTDYFKPYFFISCPGCVAEYHMDYSHVLACQYYGTKRFCSFTEPEKWGDAAARRRMVQEGHNAYTMPIPGGIQAEDTAGCTMIAGDRLWNTLQTPHWVLAGEEVSLSLNVAHRGLRYEGRLCPHEQDLEVWKAEIDDEACS